MERVKKGEKYWYIGTDSYGNISVYDTVDANTVADRNRFKANNYFNTKKEAERMARKLNAVFAGAEVIEMPPKCEILKMAEDWEINTTYANADSGSFIEGVEWIKSKIVK